MPHIHTKPGEVDFTATAYIVRLDGENPRVLLHMHKRYNRLLPVGGHVEPNETPWSAVMHEVLEEAGYLPDNLFVMQPKVRVNHTQKNRNNHPLPFLMNTHDIPNDIEHWHSDLAYLLTTNQEPTEQLAEGESQDLRWYTKRDIEALYKAGELKVNKYEVLLHIFDTLLTEYEPIPVTEFRTDKITVDH